MSEKIIQIQNLSKHFGLVKAVDEVSFDVDHGIFLTILGPSGCGKTTLLRMIAGFETPTAGKVFLQGKDVTNIPAYRRPVNLVFQRYALFPHLNVFENVAFGLEVKKIDKSIIEEKVLHMLEMVRLPNYGQRQVNQLSGGQAQRVELARALINEPEVLLLDEPLGSLDLKIRQQMQHELKMLHARLGTTFIYVTHDQEVAMSLSDIIMVMSNGKIIQQGAPTDIYSRPTNAFVADFIGHSNILNATVINSSPLQLQILGSDVTVKAEESRVKLNAGDETKVLLRPETLHILRNKESAENYNIQKGEVIDATFKGAFTHYFIKVKGTNLQVQQAGGEGIPLLTRGDQVFLGWKTEDLLLLPS